MHQTKENAVNSCAVIFSFLHTIMSAPIDSTALLLQGEVAHLNCVVRLLSDVCLDYCVDKG